MALVPLCFFSFVAGSADAKEAVYQTGFDEWLASRGDFAGWQKDGTKVSKQGELLLNPKAVVQETDPYAAGAYYEGNFYNGGNYYVGEATSPVIPAAFDFDQLIPSWNAVTPPGTWIEVLVRADFDGRWAKWYNLGIWASGKETIERHSVKLQGDTDGYVAADTLILTDKKATVTAYQIKVRLFSVNGTSTPAVRYISSATSTTPVKKSEPSTGNPAYWNKLLEVPECSQMVYVGGNVWCSPTSTSMVLSYWGEGPGTCEGGVLAAKDGIYDRIFGGTGNWPFNTAYAATFGLQGSVRRFSSMNQIEEWVAKGVPVIISFAWGNGDLTGAAVDSSNGHLVVVVGFDDKGNPIINDPAAATNEEVQRTYLRSELEPLWLGSSGGTVYLIKPEDITLESQ